MKYLPSPDAPHNQWLKFFQDKYERRRWAKDTDRPKNDVHCEHRKQQDTPKHQLRQKVTTGDLLGLQQGEMQTPPSPRLNSDQDFFAQYDL